MERTDLSNTNGIDERTSLINGTINGSRQQSFPPRRSSGQLNEATKSQRFRAIRICYFGIFVSSIVFSITVSSLWPFLQIVDKSAEATFLGWLVAAFSLGQLIASPIIGYIANRTNNNKIPLVVSTALIVVSNLLYAYIQSINTPGFSNKWWLMVSRFIMGIGAANSTIMRSYSSAATTISERTAVMANLSAYQGIGFILGPLFQALFASLKNPGPIESPWFHLNIYTAPAFFSAIVAGVNFFLFLAFKDVRCVTVQRLSTDEMAPNSKASRDEKSDQLWAIICCLYMFFVAYLTFTNYETIASPLSIDMYTWSKEKSTEYNGYILGGLGVMSVIVLIITKVLAKRYEDRSLMLGGIIICFLGYFIFLPWGDTYPSTQIATYTPTIPGTTASSLSNSTLPTLPPTTTPDQAKGCPLNQYEWCYYVPIVKLWQFILASVVITMGFTVCNVICYSIYSKKLGERPQGTMMGIFTSAGSLARAIGPITVGFLYKHWGPRVLMIFMLVVVFTGILVLVVNFRRLYLEPELPDNFNYQEESRINNGGGNDHQENRINDGGGNDHEENTINGGGGGNYHEQNMINGDDDRLNRNNDISE